MRIIGGKLKGRLLHPPQNIKARPTTDMAKESLFNILNNRIDFEGIRVLDLFSGTGSIGLEFASRGAELVSMVELEFRHTEFIKKTCLQLGIENVRVFRTDFFRFIQNARGSFDIIFADPPYDHPRFEEVAGLIMNRGILAPDGWFILEHSSKHRFEGTTGFQEERNYGKVHFSFFRNPSSE